MKRFLAVIASSVLTAIAGLIYVVVGLVAGISWLARYVIGAALATYIFLVLIGFATSGWMNVSLVMEEFSYVLAAFIGSFVIHWIFRSCLRKLDTL